MTKCTQYTLLPTQAEFLFGFDKEKYNKGETFTDISCYQGGFGSGKTFCGSLRGILYALMWAGCRGLVGAFSQELLDGTTKEKYLEHLEIMGLKEGIHWWYFDKRQSIRFRNGSSIKFKTLSNWQQFRSAEYTWIEVEEASLIDKLTFEELLARVRQQKRPEWKGYFRSIFLHTNPGGSRGWIYELFTNKKTKKKGYRIVFASTSENKHLDASYEENLRNQLSADDILEKLEGKDNDLDNSFAFPSFDTNNIVDELNYDPHYPVILSCDFNYNPMCWYLMQNIGDKWNVLKELVVQNTTTRQMCESILSELMPYIKGEIIVMGDAHGKDQKTNGSDYGVIIPFLMNNGFNCSLRIAKFNPPIKERLAVLRRTICNANNIRNLFIDSKCEYLLYNFDNAKNNLSTGTLKVPTDKEILADKQKMFLIHPIDAISYPIWFIQKVKDYD